jgi:hypothetical protein
MMNGALQRAFLNAARDDDVVAAMEALVNPTHHSEAFTHSRRYARRTVPIKRERFVDLDQR